MQEEEGEETTWDRKIASCAKRCRFGTRPVVSSVLLKFSSVQVPPSLERPGATNNGRALALEHNSSFKENWALKEKVLGNLRQKIGMPESAPFHFAVNEGMWRIYELLWTAAHLDKDGDQSQRVLRNMDVDQIQKVFSATLNQVQCLQKKKKLSSKYGSWRRFRPRVGHLYSFASWIRHVRRFSCTSLRTPCGPSQQLR